MLFVGCCAVLLSLLGRAGYLRVAAIAITGLNGALIVEPLGHMAEHTEPLHSSLATPRTLRIVTFNMSTEPRPIDNLILHIAKSAPDVVMLQEVTQAHAARLEVGLAVTFPFRHVCTHRQGCSQAVFSRIPWIEAKHVYRASGGPEMIWAKFSDPRLGRFRLISLHLAWPFTPQTQQRHIDRLIAFVREIDEPVIIGGDFNLTPWSWMIQRLLRESGLRAHALTLGSWPSSEQFQWLPPVFQIDNVLTSRGIRAISISAGPHLGSDHRPLEATLALP